ncbi:hypothetical protein O6R05_01740 [Peptoniphilus equinus]|uniref:Uncharacterized protein n=1 Tax=Peptoniphilus equinus TaxID=3016343 RepID=A0ABY7QU39_9FIRM|nr:hypothetical protein [Peptoniphilus equinus]WBW50289.1 hypothetical protein O6R05_01740 [Peptoniphilus equinus]
MNNEEIKKFRTIAIIGVILMGIGSFMASLATTSLFSNIGSGILVVSIIIATVGFIKWRP